MTYTCTPYTIHHSSIYSAYGHMGIWAYGWRGVERMESAKLIDAVVNGEVTDGEVAGE
jgi:hypothetical protein